MSSADARLPVDWPAIEALLAAFDLSLDDVLVATDFRDTASLHGGPDGLVLVGISHATRRESIAAAVADYLAFVAFDYGLTGVGQELVGTIAGPALAQLLANLSGKSFGFAGGVSVGANGMARRDRQRYREWVRREAELGASERP